MDLVQVEIDSEIEHGKPLILSGAVVRIPPEVIDDHEIVYRVRRAPDMEKGDVLIIEPKNTAATGELVVAFLGPRAYLSREDSGSKVESAERLDVGKARSTRRHFRLST